MLSVLAPTRLAKDVVVLSGSLKTIENVTGSLKLAVTSSTGNLEKSISFNTSSALYIDKVLTNDPQNNSEPVYLYKNFKSFHGDLINKLT